MAVALGSAGTEVDARLLAPLSPSGTAGVGPVDNSEAVGVSPGMECCWISVDTKLKGRMGATIHSLA